ncbi:MAG: hypothetical protein WC568_05145, partial [Candidatus Methanoperedens sp.]
DGIAVSKDDLIDLRNLSIGGHTIQVIATDRAGNNAEASTTFIVKPLPATVEIEPRTLNINSSGSWIQTKIQIPGYYASQIDSSSVRLNGTIPAEIKEIDYKEDVSELKIKFNRTLVQNIVGPGYTTLYISGKVNGAAFIGNNTIKAIENNTEENPEKNAKNNGGKS